MKEQKESKYLYENIEDEFVRKHIETNMTRSIKASVLNKRCYYIFSSLSILPPILVTIFQTLDTHVFTHNDLRVYTMILMTITMISSSVIAIFNFKEQWKINRKLVEKLKTELVSFNIKKNTGEELDYETFINNMQYLISEFNKENMRVIDLHSMQTKSSEHKKIQ